MPCLCPKSSKSESIMNELELSRYSLHVVAFQICYVCCPLKVSLVPLWRFFFLCLCIRCWMAARASTLGCRSEHYRMKKMKVRRLPPKKNPQSLSCSQRWVCVQKCPHTWFALKTLLIIKLWLFLLFLSAALSKPHLFEGRGHNRQGSDSSVDRLIGFKDEPAEPEPDNKVKTFTHTLTHTHKVHTQ